MLNNFRLPHEKRYALIGEVHGNRGSTEFRQWTVFSANNVGSLGKHWITGLLIDWKHSFCDS